MVQYQVKKLTLGPVATNCYLVGIAGREDMVIIDPGDQAQRIIEALRQMGKQPAAILLTHGHFDHIRAAETLKAHYRILVYAHEKEAELAADPRLNGGMQFGIPGTVSVDRMVKDNETLTLAGMAFHVLYTPGHTIGGVCYYLPEAGILFSGDTLFARSVGRTDLPTGSQSTLIRSVQEKLMSLPDDVRVYPGHDESTTIGEEKSYNPYVNF